jgi:Ca2+-binding RTX toxin-like protein
MAVINGTEQGDFIFGNPEADQIFGLGGDDFILGDGGNDTIEGGEGNDDLSGGDGNDLLRGGAGLDRLTGNVGADTLTGGADNDSFNWFVGIGADSTSQARDTVTDFQGAGVAGGDTLVLSANNRLVFEGARTTVPTLGASLGFGGNGFTEVFYVAGAASTLLFADSNDNGVFDATDFSVQLTGRHNLVKDDFGTTTFVVRGTEGNDVINGTAEIDRIFALGGNDVINAGNGNDIVDGGAGNDILNGGAGNDLLTGGLGNDILNGGDDRDSITGNDGADIIDGGAGNDSLLAGGNGNDIVSGGAGNDTLDGDAGNDQLFGGIGNDDLFGEDGNDQMFGEDGDDELFGDAGSDQLFGGNGDDTLEGDAGADQLNGGAGNDEFEFFLGSFNPNTPFATFDTVQDFQGAGVAGGDTLELFDEFVFRGQVTLNPQLGAVLVGGGNGITDLLYTVRQGNTWLIADEDDNGRLDSTDFTVKFLGVKNFTVGDFGNNTEFVTAGTDGNDIIVGTDGDDKIFGLAGNDQLFGQAGEDLLDGGTGDDVLLSGTGLDNLFGGEGNDTLTLEDFGSAFGGAGNDLVIGSSAEFAFQTTLEGNEGNDTLQSGSAGAFMIGGTGNDRLVGSAADDFMVGSLQFEPGLDADRFQFGALWGTDTIADFEDGTDLIDLSTSGLTFANLTIGEQFGEAVISVTGQPDVGTITLSGVAQASIGEADFAFT